MRLNINNLEILTEILTDESIFDAICDDGMTEEYKAQFCKGLLENPGFYVLHPNEYSIFIVTPRNLILYDAHVAILPEGRGTPGLKAGFSAIEYMFTKTPCRKIVCEIPENQKAARRYTKRLKFRDEGILTDSFLKNGVLQNMMIYGLSRKEWEKWDQQPYQPR